MMHGIELLILELLAGALGWSMTLPELVARTGLPRRTVAMGLAALVKRGKAIEINGRFFPRRKKGI